MIGYSNEYERLNKKKVQNDIFERYKGKKFKNVILFPSTTMNDLKLGFEKKVFDENTRFLFIEKGECYPYSHSRDGKKEGFDSFGFSGNQEKMMRKIFFLNELLEYEKEEKKFDVNRCYFHFDELYTMDLKYVCNKMNISGFDFCYFDFCGGLPYKLMNWFRYYVDYFKHSELAFTHCIDNLARGNKKTWGKFDAIKPLTYYSIIGEDRNIIGDNFENRFQNLKYETNNTHVYNANNMILFYEMIFKKRYDNLVFYKDMEGDEWNHRQKMSSFVLIDNDKYKEDIKELEFEIESVKPETILEKTGRYWKSQIYDLNEMCEKKLMDKYTYISDNQFNKLKDVLKKYVDMYDMFNFKESKRKIILNKKKEILHKTKNIKSYIKDDISTLIMFIKDEKTRNDLNELYQIKKKELKEVEIYIKRVLAMQKAREERKGAKMKEFVSFFKGLNSEDKVKMIQKIKKSVC